MIIIDLNSLLITNIVQTEHLDIDVVRNIALNMIRSTIKKFRFSYAQNFGAVLVDDGRRPWRKEIFSFYKAGRKKQRRFSDVDWNLIYEYLGEVKQEIVENILFTYVKHENCEADDVVAVLSQFASNYSEEVLIISSDRDFVQIYSPNIRQYCPLKRQFLNFEGSPTYDLLKKILYGDKGDGIPNYVSDDDCFVNLDKTPVKVSQQRVFEILSYPYYEVENILYDYETPGFLRNRQLIDFYYIPQKLQQEILMEFRENFRKKQNMNLEVTNKYFKEHNLKSLLVQLGDFEI